MVRNYVPATIYFLVDVSNDVVGLGSAAVLHFRLPGFLTHLPREVAIDVNILVRQRSASLREKGICLWPILLLGILQWGANLRRKLFPSLKFLTLLFFANKVRTWLL